MHSGPTDGARARILIVDDDPTIVAVLGGMLRDLGQVLFARSGDDALRIANERVPDLVLLDISMPGMSGLEVCAAMKESALLAPVPIIIITSHGDADQEVEALSRGAVDFIAKPPRAPLVRARVSLHLRMKAMADALRAAATIDGLTGLANRRRFDEALTMEWRRAERSREPLSLLLVDIDHFKRYNDRLGHPAGDACLRAVAGALAGSVGRAADLVARYGGEEFAVLLPNMHAEGAGHVAAKVLSAVAGLAIPHPGAPDGGVLSVSVGISTAVARPTGDKQARLAVELVSAADEGLYAAKAAGRGCARAHAVASEAARASQAPEPRAVGADA